MKLPAVKEEYIKDAEMAGIDIDDDMRNFIGTLVKALNTAYYQGFSEGFVQGGGVDG